MSLENKFLCSVINIEKWELSEKEITYTPVLSYPHPKIHIFWNQATDIFSVGLRSCKLQRCIDVALSNGQFIVSVERKKCHLMETLRGAASFFYGKIVIQSQKLEILLVDKAH